nr:hypothetical protein [Acidobacteriota bacterium]
MSVNVDTAHAQTDGEAPGETDLRFQTLVQSPLRVGLLRYLSAQPDQAFTVDVLMQAFARMRLDVENCLRELVTFGVASQTHADGVPRFGFHRPASPATRALLTDFLEQQAAVTPEDRSPAVQRFREMVGRDEKMLVVFEWIRTAAKSDI